MVRALLKMNDIRSCHPRQLQQLIILRHEHLILLNIHIYAIRQSINNHLIGFLLHVEQQKTQIIVALSHGHFPEKSIAAQTGPPRFSYLSSTCTCTRIILLIIPLNAGLLMSIQMKAWNKKLHICATRNTSHEILLKLTCYIVEYQEIR